MESFKQNKQINKAKVSKTKQSKTIPFLPLEEDPQIFKTFVYVSCKSKTQKWNC